MKSIIFMRSIGNHKILKKEMGRSSKKVIRYEEGNERIVRKRGRVSQNILTKNQQTSSQIRTI